MKIEFHILLFCLLLGIPEAASTQELMGNMSAQLKDMAFLLPAGLIAIGLRGYVIHIMAHQLGDHYSQADIKPNPGAYIDPMGILILIFFQFGWTRNDIYRKQAFQEPNDDECLLLVGASVFNFLLMLWAVLALFALPFISFPPEATGFMNNLKLFIIKLGFVNCTVAFLSLAPLYPLAGYQILFNLLDPRQRFTLEKYQSVSSLILFALLFLGEGFLFRLFVKLVNTIAGFPLIFLITFTLIGSVFFFLVVLKIDKYLLKRNSRN